MLHNKRKPPSGAAIGGQMGDADWRLRLYCTTHCCRRQGGER